MKQLSAETNSPSWPADLGPTAVYDRVKANLRYLRIDILRKAGYTTLDLAAAIGSNSDKIKRMEADLKGTVQSFIILLLFYSKLGLNLNELFAKDFKQEQPALRDLTPEERRMILVTTEEQDLVAWLFCRNLTYLRKTILKSSKMTTDMLAATTELAVEQIQRMEKDCKGKISSAVALLHYYVRRGFQVSAILSSDLCEGGEPAYG